MLKSLNMKRELKKYLNSLEEKELINEIVKLYDKFKPVKQYYELELGNDSSKLLDEFKEKIRKEYLPTRGFGRARSSIARKIVADFRKISIHSKDLVDLMLFRTEIMIEFSETFGDIDEQFYSSLESSFEQACKIIRKEKLESHVKIYCQELVSRTRDFGWGVFDQLSHILEEYIE